MFVGWLVECLFLWSVNCSFVCSLAYWCVCFLVRDWCVCLFFVCLIGYIVRLFARVRACAFVCEFDHCGRSVCLFVRSIDCVIDCLFACVC